MEKEKLFMNEVPAWNSSMFGMEIEPNQLNCGSEQLPNCFFNPNWDNSMDQSDPFESALSSMVSSPAASMAGIPSSGSESVVLRELIGRLGGICNSGEISPQSGIASNNSANNSCYATPLNSPPKLNLSLMDHQMKGNLSIRTSHHSNLAPLSADPGFAERAARLSCFGSRNLGQFAVNEGELAPRLAPTNECGKLSRVSSNHSIKIAGSPMEMREINDGISSSDKKFSRFSRSSTPENAEIGDSREESSVREQIPGDEMGMRGQSDANGRKRKSAPRGKAKETTPSSSMAKDSKECDESKAKRSKSDGSNGNEKDATKAKSEASENGNQMQAKDSAKPPEPPKDYIHVRARRGQATDAHSLAERVRREKISQRMKFLQDLVPGCNKVTGKAVMLDEIINYVQSLQRQVEFLSMKLATVNPKMDFNLEVLSKDIFQSRGSMLQNVYPLEAASPALFPYGFQSPHGSSLQNGIPNGTENPLSMNPLNAALHQNQSIQLPHIDVFGEAASLASTFMDDDLQSVVHMGFGQNQAHNFQGTIPTSQMKVEL